MLAHIRLRLILFLPALLLAILPAAAGAQIHGVAPSVTSFGFGGSNNPTPGVPASVTSLGPNGFDCCSGPFISPFNIPSQQMGFAPRFDGSRSHRHRFHDRLRFPVGVIVPAYVPYMVPYPVEYAEDDAEDGDAADADSGDSRRGRLTYDSSSWARDASATRQKPAKVAAYREAPAARESAPAPAPDSPTPVSAQPSTVLIFKDGHKTEVQNYAVVGDTLFDFSGNLSHKIQLADLDLPATEKANDERGVQFQIPAQKGQ